MIPNTDSTITDLSKVLKGKKPVIYLRVSSREQATRGGGLLSQKKVIEGWLKMMKLTKKPIIYREQVSGGKEVDLRPEWNSMISFILDQKDPSDYFIIMRDFTRWSRHGIYGPTVFSALYNNGVELVSVTDNASTGTKFRPDDNGEFLFSLWMALGGRERTGGAKRTQIGVETARLAGKIAGQPLNLDKPWKELVELFPKIEIGELSVRSIVKNNPEMTRGWLRKAIQRVEEINQYGIANNIPDALEQWIDVVMKLKDIRDKFGKDSREFKVARTQTSGFVLKPVKFWTFKPTKEQLADYVTNPNMYLIKKK